MRQPNDDREGRDLWAEVDDRPLIDAGNEAHAQAERQGLFGLGCDRRRTRAVAAAYREQRSALGIVEVRVSALLPLIKAYGDASGNASWAYARGGDRDIEESERKERAAWRQIVSLLGVDGSPTDTAEP